MIQLKLCIVNLKPLDDLDETIGWFSRNYLMVQLWNTWMVQLKFVDDSAETLGWFDWNSRNWTIKEFHLNYPRVPAKLGNGHLIREGGISCFGGVHEKNCTWRGVHEKIFCPKIWPTYVEYGKSGIFLYMVHRLDI